MFVKRINYNEMAKILENHIVFFAIIYFLHMYHE